MEFNLFIYSSFFEIIISTSSILTSLEHLACEGKIKFLEKRNGNNNKNMAKNFNIVRKRKS